MNANRPLLTPTVDLLVPSDRFAAASRIHGRLHRWWLLLRQFWWLVALIFIGVFAPVLLWTGASGPAYESRARMWLTGRLDLYEGRLYTEELINYLGTQVELLRSREIQGPACQRLREQFPPGAEPTGGGIAVGRRLLDTVRSFWKGALDTSETTRSNAPPPCPFRVTVTEGAKSSTLELRALGPEPARTQAFLDDLMAEYLRFKKQAREQTSERTAASLGAELAQLRHEVETQQASLHAFQSSNSVVFLQEQGNGAASYLASLNRRLASLRTEWRLLKSLQPEQWVELKAGTASPPARDVSVEEAAARDSLANLAATQVDWLKANQHIQVLKAKRNGLSRYLRPAHLKIVKLDKEIATEEKLVQILKDEAEKQLADRRQFLDSQIRNLEAESRDWDGRAIEASRKLADYEQIRQNLLRLQTAYDKTHALLQTVDVSKKVEQENVGVLEPASRAVRVHRLLRNVALALGGSLLLSLGAIAGLAWFKDDFTSLDELTRQLAEPVVGQIPAIALSSPGGRSGVEFLEKQRFEFLEAFRNLRSSVLFMGKGERRPQVIVIGSSIPEEGKSTVALYLAATLAKAHARVLLLDADLRRATLHKYFAGASSPGLADVLHGHSGAAEVIVPTGLENLSFMPAGEARRDPGELVLSSAWTKLLKELRQSFDYILVDTPPLLATDDTASLAPKADGVLFVVRGSYTSARMARGALDTLRRRQASLLGLIFNGVVSSPYERYSYRRYETAYHWVPAAAGDEEAPRRLVEDIAHP